MTIPLLVLSDHPTATSGLGRITRELALRIHERMSDTFRVACLGCGATDRLFLPFQTWGIRQMKDWVVADLPECWKAFAGDERGILLVIWDASRILWLAQPEKHCPHTTPEELKLRDFLLNKPFDLWTYSAIDADGPNGKLSVLLREVLRGCDRVLAYSEWSAAIVEKTLEGFPHKPIEALPHGIDPAIWHPRGRDKARRKFGELVFDAEFSVKPEQFLIGIVATNQARKDFGTAIKAVAQIAETEDVLIWIHTDTLERHWSLSALLYDYNLMNRCIVTHGQLTDEQLTWAYSACDVTFGIGLGEGFGYPIYESLACGIPCIHGNYAGGAEWLPKEFKIEPVAYRFEGTFGSVRPVYNAEQWVDAATRLKNETARLPKELDWNNLWPRWEEWLRKGIA